MTMASLALRSSRWPRPSRSSRFDVPTSTMRDCTSARRGTLMIASPSRSSSLSQMKDTMMKVSQTCTRHSVRSCVLLLFVHQGNFGFMWKWLYTLGLGEQPFGERCEASVRPRRIPPIIDQWMATYLQVVNLFHCFHNGMSISYFLCIV